MRPNRGHAHHRSRHVHHLVRRTIHNRYVGLSVAELNVAYVSETQRELRSYMQTHDDASSGQSGTGSSSRLTDRALNQAVTRIPWAAFCRAITQAYRSIWFAGAAGVLALCSIILLAGTVNVYGRPVKFSFAQPSSCFGSPALFPDAVQPVKDAAFAVSHKPTVRLFGSTVLSLETCVTPRQVLSGQANYSVRQGIGLLGGLSVRPLQVLTDAYPTATTQAQPRADVPLLKPLTVQLRESDAVFDYVLAGNEHVVSCDKRGRLVVCPLTTLQLDYGADYVLSLERTFHGVPAGQAVAVTVHTITATAIVQSSIANRAVVYDQPQQIILTTNKSVETIGGVRLTAIAGSKTIDLAFQSAVSGAAITITIDQPLPRRATINVQVQQVTAADQSGLEAAYMLTFTTSGGPALVGTNLPTSGVSLRSVVTIYFDQLLQPAQPTAGLVSVMANGSAVPITTTISGDRMLVALAADLPRCAVLVVKTTAAVTSLYGLSGDSAWIYSSRSICYTTSSIGTSIRGRPITAYQFGPGGNVVLYMGSLHGTESNTANLLAAWINELDAHPDSIPAGRTIVVIPQLNPDGVIANTRQNVNDIDLNRNFPAPSWQTRVTEPGGNGVITNQGGPSPLSEPESQAIAAYVQAQRPRMTVDYHSHAALVQGNGSGDSDQVGPSYGAKAGYWSIPSTYTGTVFDYSTTGSFEEWTASVLNVPELLVELRTSQSDEFSANRSAMWTVAQL